MEGYIQIHRKIQTHWLWENPLFVRAWLHCLFRANYESKKVLIGTELVLVGRGEFATSISKFSDATGLSFQQTRAFWELLEEDKMITKVTTSKLTKITVCKYDDYQVTQQTEKQSQQQTSNKQITKGTPKNQQRQPSEDEQIAGDGNTRATSGTPEKQQQRKKKEERKEKEINKEKVLEVKFPKELSSPKFKKYWKEDWIKYRKEMKHPSAISAQQRNLTTLLRLSNGNTTTAIQILQQSIDQNWQGLFALKMNGKPNHTKSRIGSRQGNGPGKEYKPNDMEI